MSISFMVLFQLFAEGIWVKHFCLLCYCSLNILLCADEPFAISCSIFIF
uniref:Uncharacterized protein n=1 Tax=Rhizophora mucronata TaxID=61149 RepID=A0A2P2NTB9_RHIMU